MSSLITGLVWELPVSKDFTAEDKFILLAYADHAWQDGTHAFPSIELVANKTGYFERTVQRHVRKLEKLGLLILDGKGQHGTNSYSFPLKKRPDGSQYLEYIPLAGCQADTPVTETPVSPVTPEGMTPEELTPELKVVLKDLDIYAPDPIAEKLTAGKFPFNPNSGTMIQFWKEDFPDPIILRAIDDAISRGKNSMAYVDRILVSWKANGVPPTREELIAAARQKGKPNGQQPRANSSKPLTEPTEADMAAARLILADRESVPV